MSTGWAMIDYKRHVWWHHHRHIMVTRISARQKSFVRKRYLVSGRTTRTRLDTCLKADWHYPFSFSKTSPYVRRSQGQIKKHYLIMGVVWWGQQGTKAFLVSQSSDYATDDHYLARLTIILIILLTQTPPSTIPSIARTTKNSKMKSTISLFLLMVSLSADAFVTEKSGSGRFVSKDSRTSTTELFERKSFITGNWKLNPQTKAEAVDLARGIAASIPDNLPCDVGLFVPVPFIETVQAVVGDKLIVGAEVSNMWGKTFPSGYRIVLLCLEFCCVPWRLWCSPSDWILTIWFLLKLR